MLSLLSSSAGLNMAASRPAVKSVRAQSAQMFDISEWGNIWGIEAKKAVFAAWDPEKPRDYDNFNPFERNLDGGVCDTNGCFPGESRGYQPPQPPGHLVGDHAGREGGDGGDQGRPQVRRHRQAGLLLAQVAGEPRRPALDCSTAPSTARA